ncbi:MAG: hypothetical protein CVU05_02175 [Bacteroidetes bacterium HGW-Bacteroidetes-21]|jgi:SecD/SecF fusion protein|nr:MAG: hypothetical protein CVU05_02175 [Bacteroidetes bacterium HGW-Bacteroidetes-21]
MKTGIVFLCLFVSTLFISCSAPANFEKDGGLRLTLTINYSDFLKSYCINKDDTLLTHVLHEITNEKVNNFSGFMDLYQKTLENIYPGTQMATSFMSFEMQDKINFNTSNDELKNIFQTEWDAVIKNVINILTKRIESIDIENASITIQNGNTLIVEIPGIKEKEKMMNLVPSIGDLGFWETYTNEEFFTYLQNINDYLKKSNFRFAEDSLNTKNKNIDSTDIVALIESQNNEIDNNNIEENPLFNVLIPAINNEGKFMYGAVIGYVNMKDTAKFNQLLKMDSVLYLLPHKCRLMYAIPNKNLEGNVFEIIALKCTNREGRPAIDGTIITSAKAEKSDYGFEISIVMNTEGAKMWKRMTAENIGRQIAIVLDNKVYSFPTVQTPIEGGKSMISGNFTEQEAKNLASILNAGKYPVKVTISQIDVVEGKK